MPVPLDPADFPDYSGEPSSITCPKCGSNTNYTYWVSEVLTLWSNGQISDAHPDGSYDLPDDPGFMVRQCIQCSHCRGEKVVDTAVPAGAKAAAPADPKKKETRTITINQIPGPTDAGPFYLVK